MTDGCLYPNQQLKLVSVEAYFAGQMSTLLRLDQLQKRLQPRFTNLLVPMVRSDLAPALQPYQFDAEAGLETVSVAVNQIAYSTNLYPGFAKFGDRGAQLIGEALDLFEIESVDRVAYRYENEVGVQKTPDGAVPLQDVLKLDSVAWFDGKPVMQMDARWSTKLDHGVQFVQVRTEDIKAGSNIQFTISAVVTPGGKAARLRELIGLAHSTAATCFERMITDEFRAHISQQKGH